jgi:hypothetical protein
MGKIGMQITCMKMTGMKITFMKMSMKMTDKK